MRLKAKGAFLKAVDQLIDTTTAAGKAFLDMLAVFAEFETNLRRERQLEGIAKAKANGVYKGGKPRIDRQAVIRLKEDGKGPTEIARQLGISRMHVYRITRVRASVHNGAKRTGWSITGPSRILHWLRNGRELHRRDCCTHSATPGHSIRKDLLSKSAPERHATSVARVRQDVCRFLHVLA